MGYEKLSASAKKCKIPPLGNFVSKLIKILTLGESEYYLLN